MHAVEVFGKRVYGVHLKNVKDALSFTILGQGDLRIADLLKAQPPTSIPIASRSSSRESRKTRRTDIKICLAQLHEVIAAIRPQ